MRKNILENVLAHAVMSENGRLTSHGQDVAAALYDYGVRGLTVWIKEGVAEGKCRYPPDSGVLERARLDRYLRDDLVQGTVIAALTPFFRNLRAGKYDSSRSKVHTYFLGQCRNYLAMETKKYSFIIRECPTDPMELYVIEAQSDRSVQSEFLSDEMLKALAVCDWRLRRVLTRMALLRETLDEASTAEDFKAGTIRSKLSRIKSRLKMEYNAGHLDPLLESLPAYRSLAGNKEVP